MVLLYDHNDSCCLVAFSILKVITCSWYHERLGQIIDTVVVCLIRWYQFARLLMVLWASFSAAVLLRWLIIVLPQRLSLCQHIICVSVFYTSNLWGGQDRAFQFQGGLAYNKAHYDLSWFSPLLKGNSPTSSSLILKMNICYKGVNRELKKFTWWKGEMDLIPPAWRVGGLL
jgi:hypothetical protein